MTPLRPPPRRHARLLALACAVPLTVVGCSTGSDPAGAPPPPAPSDSAATGSSVPAGWTTVEQAGMTLAVPPDFEPIQPSGATVTYGIPYTDQTFPPPKVDVFVEQEEVGSLEVRVPLVVGNIENELGISVEEVEEVEVAGASAAAELSYEYTTAGGKSVSGVQLEPTAMRQSELLIDVPGLPKYGLRYSAPTEQYDEQVWEDLKASVTVDASGSSAG